MKIDSSRSRKQAIGCFLVLAASSVVADLRWSMADQLPRPAQPNVILILADDLGYETLGANGGQSYRTPNLDRLAQQGVRMEHCYVQPLCTPTRVQLMTGAYNIRNYTAFGEMDARLKTFGNLFRDAGYATCVVGKWQLGRDRQLPRTFGFDEHYLWQHTRRPPRYANPGLEINAVEVDYTNGEYGPDLLNRFAIEFIERHRTRPFFLYYPMTLTHSPYQPTPDSAGWDPKAMGEQVNRRREHFADMVAYMDKLVGALLAKLDELQLRENTLVIFLADNGTGQGVQSRLNGQIVSGGKGKTTVFGMRVPCIVAWPGVIPPGQVYRGLVDSTDFLPSICEAAGIQFPGDWQIDGRSFWPQMLGKPGIPRQWVYCWYSPRGEPPREFAFDHRYKLYRTGELYDMAADPHEQQPLKQDELTDEVVRAATRLQEVLDSFRDARPKELRN